MERKPSEKKGLWIQRAFGHVRAWLAVAVVVVVVAAVERTADKSWLRGMSSLTAQLDVSDGLAVRAQTPACHFCCGRYLPRLETDVDAAV